MFPSVASAQLAATVRKRQSLHGGAELFWETLAALFLLLTTFWLWFVAALAWGLIRLIINLVTFSVYSFNDPHFGWGDFWAVPLAATFTAAESAWSIPSGIWHWAKFEHPGWAVVIGVVCIGFLGSSARR